MNVEQKNMLSSFINEEAVSFIAELLDDLSCCLLIKNERKTKLGDFACPNSKRAARISINSNLNKDAFLLVLLHEIAHAKVCKDYSPRVKPHGKEWKTCFTQLLVEFIDFFSPDLKEEVLLFSKKPKSSLSADITLIQKLQLKSFDEDAFLIDKVNDGDTFVYKNKEFKRIEKRRKNILAQELSNRKYYIFKPFVEVEKLN